ncbi:MAG TPA: hypothetical protein VGJ36_08130 [Gemmatimonadales bacterium]|jgi:hypothetical protein
MANVRLLLSMLLAGVVMQPAGLSAQTPARDPSGVLEQVLPPAVAQQVLDRIAEARSRGLPAAALEHRALELHAKGLPSSDIPEAVTRVADAMAKGKNALEAGGRTHPSDSEIEAAGTASQNGVSDAALTALANSTPGDHSMAVPIAVLSSLVDRGLTSQEALSRVVAKLEAHASDRELAELPAQAGGGLSHKPEVTGQDLAGTKRPASVPANGGQATRPASVPPTSTPGHPGGRP